MEKRQIRILSLLLALVMVVGSLPSVTFAEETKADWTATEEELAGMDFWRLAKTNKVLVVANAEGVKVPTINYIGSYIRNDGRTVLRISYRKFQNLATDIWERAHFKFEEGLYDLIDFDDPGTGMYKGHSDREFHDDDTYKEIVPFKKVSYIDAGAYNIKEQNLATNGNNAGAHNINEIPIDLVLDEGKTTQDIVGEPHIQMRLVDKEYKRVFSLAGTKADKVDGTEIYPYNSYTFMTFIPSANNRDRVNTESDVYNDRHFYGANVFAKYYEEKGYFEVIYKLAKKVSINDIGGERYVFRQVFENKFADLLKKDSNGAVAEMFIGDQQGEKWENNKKIFISKDDINIGSEGGALKPGFAGIQVGTNLPENSNLPKIDENFAGLKTKLVMPERPEGMTDSEYKDLKNKYNPNQILLNGSTSEFNSGLPTVVRYYVDRDKVRKAGLTADDLASFYFFTTFIAQGSKDVARYEGTNNSGEDLILNQNDKIEIFYPDGNTMFPELRLNEYSLKIGSEPYDFELRSNFSHEGGGGSNRGKKWAYTVTSPNGLKIPQGEKIVFRTAKYTNLPSKVEITINGTKLTLNPGENGPLVNNPRRLDYISTYSGGSASQTSLTPDVDEIFTDSTEMKGRTKYTNADINLYNSNSEKTVFKGDKGNPINANVNGDECEAYNFRILKTDTPILQNLKKDDPLVLSNTDVMTSAVESETVTEKVQAKVKFDLNGGKLPTTVKSFEGFKSESSVLTGTEFAYLTNRGDEIQPVTRIVPMNEKFSNEEGYKPNGFSGGTTKDHNGGELSGEALELRQFLGKEDSKPTLEGRKFLGWSTKPIDGSLQEVLTKWNSLEVADTVEKTHDTENNYKFTEESPITEGLTVYAVWGGPTLVLHSNNTADPKDETVVYIPYTTLDRDFTNQEIDNIDGITSASITSLKSNNTIKKLPLAPYTSTSNDGDEALKDFKKENSTFVGWTLTPKRDATDVFVAGQNNERISGIINGVVNDNGVPHKIPKNTESSRYLEQQNKIAYVPNGFNFSVNKGFDTLVEEAGEIHLYANYRNYFEIKVDPRYRNIENQNFGATDGNYGQYVDDVDDAKKHPLTIGLIYRTAVTDYNKPTVLQNATYNPITTSMGIAENEILKTFDPAGTEQFLSWNLPGYDRFGRRRSYVSIVIPEGKEEEYKTFSEESWGNFGISIYAQRSGESGEVQWEKDAPKDLFNESAPNAYGEQLAKRQAFKVESGEKLDAYTSATFRRPSKVTLGGYDEITGYTIFSTNTPTHLPTPIVNNIMDTDTGFTVDGTASEQNAEIEKIHISYPVSKEGTDFTNATVVLTKQVDGTFSGAVDGNSIVAKVVNGKLEFSKTPAFNFQGLDDGMVFVTYENAQQVKSETGKTQIKKKPNANKVSTIEQKHNTEDGKSVIDIQIPIEPVTGQPQPGTVYEVEKYNESTKTWDKVGTGTIQKGQGPGDYVPVTLDGVENNDLLRIISKEEGKIDTYSITEVPENPQSIKGEGWIKIDRVGPKGEIKATDSKFRRFINIDGDLTEIPEDEKVILEIDYSGQGQGNENNDKKDFITLEKSIEYLNTVPRLDNMPKMWILAKDRFGNPGVVEVVYTRTYQNIISVLDAKIRRNSINVTSNIAGIEVTAIVYRGGAEVARGTSLVTDANKYVRLTLKNGENKVRLKKNDRIRVTSIGNVDGKTYTSNPFDIVVK
ncbi:MAG: hypothetical protein Q4E02_00435 [Lagierella massiliensis]|nr:hypothetical protein [Lagierella massiliensis]